VTEEPEGYTFEYAADIAPPTVEVWVDLERKCCPFLRFTVDIPEDTGSLRLHVLGNGRCRGFPGGGDEHQSWPPESIGR
jgi:hypothetical protein